MLNLTPPQHEASFCIFGLKGSGKSTLVDYILRQYGPQALLYDTLHEAPQDAPYDFIRPKHRYNLAELEAVIGPLRTTKQNRYKLFMIDETNRFAPSKPAPLPSALADLNDQNRHYHLAVGYVARRPSQLNQDLTELATYLFLFHLAGRNDVKFLNNLATNLGDTVANLPEYHFVLVPPRRSEFQVMKPITPDKSFLHRAANS